MPLCQQRRRKDCDGGGGRGSLPLLKVPELVALTASTSWLFLMHSLCVHIAREE